MRWTERQAKVEEKTYEIIDDIAEEIGVEVPYLPEVYWVGRKLKFESLGIPNRHRRIFEDLQFRENNEVNLENFSAFLPNQKIILLGRPSIIDASEEGTHFLHLVNSNLELKNSTILNYFGKRTIMEMFGFFGSKLIYSNRKNNFKTKEDPLGDKDFKKILNKLESAFSKVDKEDYEFLIYNQGYGLGEKLFNSYISNEIPMKNIEKLFINPMSKKNQAIETFLELKSDFFSYLND